MIAHKIAFIAYDDSDPERGKRFLIQLPAPKRGDAPETMQWGIVRGTARSNNGQDVASLEALLALPEAMREPPQRTALNEAAEEAGIQESDILDGQMKDCGLHDYDSPNRAPYPIHCFAARVDAAQLPAFQARCLKRDTQALAFKTLSEMAEMAKNKDFKEGYVGLLHKINALI
jgi:8-oxo-dGTP pyrophosphatase MutT (NUDIX family)